MDGQQQSGFGHFGNPGLQNRLAHCEDRFGLLSDFGIGKVRFGKIFAPIVVTMH